MPRLNIPFTAGRGAEFAMSGMRLGAISARPIQTVDTFRSSAPPDNCRFAIKAIRWGTGKTQQGSDTYGPMLGNGRKESSVEKGLVVAQHMTCAMARLNTPTENSPLLLMPYLEIYLIRR